MWEQEFLNASHVATALVAAHWVGVVTLGVWVAGRLGVGVRVRMGDVDMGVGFREGGEVKVELECLVVSILVVLWCFGGAGEVLGLG